MTGDENAFSGGTGNADRSFQLQRVVQPL